MSGPDAASLPVDGKDAMTGSALGFTSVEWKGALRNLAIAWAFILALFWRDAGDMAAIWWNSSTFNHCLLILPILWWLVDQRKAELGKLQPQLWALPLLWIGAGALGWMLGNAGEVALARHLALVMMLQGSVALLLGPAVTFGLLFPLFYMLFLVPFGEEFVPALQILTADICMWLLGLTGVPAHIDGIYISTPTALFRVAEACSGVKFLIAMVALGALVANLCFSNWPRRIAFMAACIVIPIIANGIRAFGTIYIAHHGNVDFAASFDHVVYGWVFFGVVIALVLGAGWPFLIAPPMQRRSRWMDGTSARPGCSPRPRLSGCLPQCCSFPSAGPIMSRSAPHRCLRRSPCPMFLAGSVLITAQSIPGNRALSMPATRCLVAIRTLRDRRPTCSSPSMTGRARAAN